MTSDRPRSIGVRPRKSALYPVVLECGHEVLVTGGQYFSGFVICFRCSGEGRMVVRAVVRSLTLRNVHCHRVLS